MLVKSDRRSICRKPLVALALGLAPMIIAVRADAQTVPTLDTEDATLGVDDVSSSGRLHPSFAIDLRNGDFARGSYDDDRADLSRLPVHAQVGLALDLGHDGEGKATSWFVVRSSNGFHSPAAGETTRPRAWYESNNLAAFVFSPAAGLRAGALYTIKTSPNGVSATTHEASLTFAYDGKDAIGVLKPTFVTTVRPKGDHGLYTQLGIAPSLALGPGDGAPKLSVPAAIGVGWRGFYGQGAGSRLFGNVGLALERPFVIGGTHWGARAEALALIRDDRLARSSGPDGETGTVVPLVTLSLSMAY